MYTETIRGDLASLGRVGTNPVHVEAWMRSELGTLDHLSRAEFRREVSLAARCADRCDAAFNDELAASLGLTVEARR